MSWLDKLLGRKRAPTALELLSGASWTCTSCNAPHRGMFDLGTLAPDYWPHARVHEPNGALRLDGDFLSEDFCVIGGEDFFIRCVFLIPVHGLCDRFGFGTWSTLSRSNFESYVDHFDDARGCELGPWFGYFSNRLIGFSETVPEPCTVTPRTSRLRPTLSLKNQEHDLAIAQRDGITPERVLEIYREYGHGLG